MGMSEQNADNWRQQFAVFGESATWNGAAVTLIPTRRTVDTGEESHIPEPRRLFHGRYSEVTNPGRNDVIVYQGETYRVDRINPLDEVAFQVSVK